MTIVRLQWLYLIISAVLNRFSTLTHVLWSFNLQHKMRSLLLYSELIGIRTFHGLNKVIEYRAFL